MSVNDTLTYYKYRYKMSLKTKENNLLKILQKTGLNYNEALVYFALLKTGPKGSIVKELTHALPIQRTNIYSILHKLIKVGCVKESGFAEKSKNATIYIATDPLTYLKQLINIKQKEFENIKRIQETYSEVLQSIFLEGLEYPYDDIASILKPYLRPLIENGWKIKSYIERNETLIFYYKVYDCMLFTKKAKILKDCSFHMFLFEYSIEDDENALIFFSQGLKRKTKEMKSYFFDIKEFELIDDSVELFGKSFPIFNMKVKVKDIKNSNYFLKNSHTFKEIETLSSNGFYEIGKAVILPIKNKIFYLWAESDIILKELIEPIIKLEYNRSVK